MHGIDKKKKKRNTTHANGPWSRNIIELDAFVSQRYDRVVRSEVKLYADGDGIKR